MQQEKPEHKFSHIYWLGGSPCAGKSSIADILTQKYGWQHYCCDDAYERHSTFITPSQQPTYARLCTLSGDALWMRPLEQQIRDEIQVYKEEFPLILTDLLALPTTTPILLEGNALLPELVAPLLKNRMQAFWLVPTPAFQLKYYAQRTWVKDVIASCTDPEQAFINWMQRDIAFATYVTKTAQAHNLSLLQVDGSSSLEGNTKQVANHFRELL